MEDITLSPLHMRNALAKDADPDSIENDGIATYFDT